MILLSETLTIGLRMLGAHKLRSVLSISGIVFGIITLVVTLSIGEGTRRKVMRTIEAMGANLVHVKPKAVLQEGDILSYAPLTLRECERLDQLKGVQAYSLVLGCAAVMVVRGFEEPFAVQGTIPQDEITRDLTTQQGRFLAFEDLAQHSRVVVLGADLAADLAGAGKILDRDITLFESRFRVIGVLARKGRTIGADFDRTILMPLTTLQELQGKGSEVHGVWIRAESPERTRDVISQIRSLFVRTDLEIWDQESLLIKRDKMTRAFKWALGSIALVSLLIGGIGIMNVLLVSVAERIREIGIRKAVGASQVDIFLQFLLESFSLTFLGSLIGMVLGTAIAGGVAGILNALIPTQQGWEAASSANAIGISLHFTFWIAMIFGVYPAWNASKLDPCEALIYS